MPLDNILRSADSHDFAGLNHQKACGPSGVPSLVLKTCGSVLTASLAKLKSVYLLLLPFLTPGSLLTISLSLKSVTVQTPQITM